MESVVKRSLLAPMKTLQCCVSGDKQQASRSQGQRSKVTRVQDPRVLRSYEAELQKERKLREAMNAKKNAERAAMRAHFRRKYQLSQNAKDSAQLRAVGGKVFLSGDLARMVRPDAPEKDDGFNLIRAFQGLKFSGPMFTGSKHSRADKTTNEEPCRVMRTDAQDTLLFSSSQCSVCEISIGSMFSSCAGSVCARPHLCVRASVCVRPLHQSSRSAGAARLFQEIPDTGSNGWMNLLRFWRDGRFSRMHKHMEESFRRLGPIYREHLGSQSSVNIMLPMDTGELFRSEGLHPRRMTLQPWATHRETRRHSKGVFLKNGTEWRADRLLLNREVMVSSSVHRFLPLLDEVAQDFCRSLRRRVQADGFEKAGQHTLTLDPSPDLFRFALEASCHVLYGERIGLFSSCPSDESERFISAVERMLATTPPLLYLPPRLLLRLRASLWTTHATAWDDIFSHAEQRIQRSYQRLQARPSAAPDCSFPGVLGKLMEAGQLSLELIRANITELMAGGVDTTAVPLQFALFELARNPDVQECVRAQVLSSWQQASGDPLKALQGAPLLKGTIKETLRLYPVGITVQRYPVRDIVLQNYHVPAGTLVQVCLYPLGRSAEVFSRPECFDPSRWSADADAGSAGGFRSLAFGFGSRQCVGRRIAENEMQLLLMHILRTFKLTVSSTEELSTKYTLILQPECPPRITFSTLTHQH
ncbi:cytochrome P450 11C1 isoform X2 [Danio rerio]|uniref:steroid 11beta-monooxygenase n=2 Tax=Danio rerio TaxID=7955 RepID=A0A8M9PD87_DANRE|nr:cytochrome P450, family 11, subfamily C, polypeptide 1 isoform X2 [Danio rerio]|eukprot:XP_021322434.1 cytochrome P450, family 11, subfamily C, polypeptide 1 isoform X2 [Danio rerio]